MPDPLTPEEQANRRNIRKAQESIKLEVDKVIESVFQSMSGAKLTNDNFRLADNPRFLKQVNEAMKNFRVNIEVIFVNSLKGSFETSQANLINTIYQAYDGRAITDPVKALLNTQYDDVLEAFLKRSVNGLGLSDRLWQLTYQLQREIEWTIFAGLSEGQSAQTMARSMKRFLKNPDALFRRVRNAKGKLVLSSNAKKFNPGQGVYRSSYKNAMRLSRTEINTAYRTADHEQYKNKPYVLGIEVRLSDRHIVTDVCDFVKGIYPASFKFVGWHPQCYDSLTEVYTKRGWIPFPEIEVTDHILSLNPITRDLEWSAIKYYFGKEYKGKMVNFHNKSLDMMVTPDHKMVFLGKGKGVYFIDKLADDYKHTHGGLYRSSEYQSDSPRYFEIGSHKIEFDLFCEFMGYYLADGSYSQTRCSEVFISQSRTNDIENRSKIKDCLERIGFNFWESESGLGMNDLDLKSYVSQFGKCHEKYIPVEILNSSPESIRVFLDAFLSCDGNVTKPKSFIGNKGAVFTPKRDTRVYYSTSKLMADQLGELMLKVGNRPSFHVDKSKGRKVKFKNGEYTLNYDLIKVTECYGKTSTVFKKDYVDYDGIVYDVELEKNHILYTRRNGKCVWGSNCICYQIPILASKEEFDRYQRAILDGTDKDFVFSGRITDIPENAKKWVEDNKERIQGWKSEPWFIRDNKELREIVRD